MCIRDRDVVCAWGADRNKNFGEDRSSSLAENRLTNGNCAATQLQFDDRRPFVMLAFENKLKYWIFDFSVFIGHQFSTLCEILVRFGSVTPEFTT